MISYQHSLKELNSFGIAAQAEAYLALDSLDKLSLLRDWREQPNYILGAGSNILLQGDIPGLVIHNQLKGKRLIGQDKDFVYLEVGAGENWQELVLYCLANNWAGLENLALIPGSVGAAPVQNIGAYGVEFSEVCHLVQAWDRKYQEMQKFEQEDCRFGYRDSVFKSIYPGRFIICSLVLKLRRQPLFRLEYGSIREELGQQPLSIRAVAEAVMRIRRAKLPDPKVLPNAGSFFKNPIVSEEFLGKLLAQYPQMPHYPQADGKVKLAAGWLIDQAAWKGKKIGVVGVHDRQALVLVNHGGAKGKEIAQLAEAIQQDIIEKFGVNLEPEVNYWP